MYTITFVRAFHSNKWHLNYRDQGAFIKHFNSLNEIANFVQSTNRLYFVNLDSELSKREIRILANKIVALRQQDKEKRHENSLLL